MAPLPTSQAQGPEFDPWYKTKNKETNEGQSVASTTQEAHRCLVPRAACVLHHTYCPKDYRGQEGDAEARELGRERKTPSF